MELLTAAYVLPIDHEPIQNGAMVTDMGKILAIGTSSALTARYPDVARTDFPTQLIMPGLVNAHLHCDLTQFFCPDYEKPASATETSPHTYWMKHALRYRRQLHHDQQAASVRLGIARLIQYGVTCVGAATGYEGSVELFDEAGIRAVIFPEIYASGPTEHTRDRFESALAILDNDEQSSELIRFGLAPLAPYLLSRNMLRIISEHAKEHGLPLQIHAAESFDEMEFFFNSSGPIGTEVFGELGWGPNAGLDLPPAFQKTPIQYLGELGLCDAAPTIIGAVQLGIKDIPLLAAKQCQVICCPRAIETFQFGEFPYGKLTEHHIPIGLGTESHFTACDGDLWDEMRTMLHWGGITPNAILALATRGSAHVLGWEHMIGTLTPGKSADYLVIDMPPMPDPYFVADAIIRHTSPQRIRQTVVAGQLLKNA